VIISFCIAILIIEVISSILFANLAIEFNRQKKKNRMQRFLLILLSLLLLSLAVKASVEVGDIKDSLSFFEGHRKAIALLEISNLYYPNNNDSALYYAEKALLEYKNTNDKKGTASCYGLIGAIYSSYGIFDTAIVLTYKVVEWGEKNNDIRAFIAYLELANIYETMGQLDKAKEFYFKGINGSYLPAKRAAFANMGLLALKSKDYDSAAYFFNGALNEYSKADSSLPINKYNIATIYHNLALVYYAKEMYEEGISLLNESLSISQEIENNSSIAKAYLSMGEGYKYLNRDDSLFFYLKKAEKITDSLQITGINQDVYFRFFEYYQKHGYVTKALEYNIKYNDIRYDIAIKSYKTIITETETKYKVKEKTNKILALEKEKDRVYNYSIGIILGVLLISSIIILALNNRRLKHRNAKVLSDAKSFLANEKAQQIEQKLERIKKNFHEKSSLIEVLQQEINKISNKDEQKQLDTKVQMLRRTRILTDDDWLEYKMVFNEIYPQFSSSIQNYDALSMGDERQLIFLKLGLTQKEIAYLMGISTDGVKRARQRVSKKIGLDSSGELNSFIGSL